MPDLGRGMVFPGWWDRAEEEAWSRMDPPEESHTPASYPNRRVPAVVGRAYERADRKARLEPERHADPLGKEQS